MLDTRVTIAHFDRICGNDHPCITRLGSRDNFAQPPSESLLCRTQRMIQAAIQVYALTSMHMRQLNTHYFRHVRAALARLHTVDWPPGTRAI